MTKFLLQTYAIAGVRAELDKQKEEYDFAQKQLDNPDICEYNEKYYKEKRETAGRAIYDCERLIKEIEEYEF